jgi:hypothetical protein
MTRIDRLQAEKRDSDILDHTEYGNSPRYYQGMDAGIPGKGLTWNMD